MAGPARSPSGCARRWWTSSGAGPKIPTAGSSESSERETGRAYGCRGRHLGTRTWERSPIPPFRTATASLRETPLHHEAFLLRLGAHPALRAAGNVCRKTMLADVRYRLVTNLGIREADHSRS